MVNAQIVQNDYVATVQGRQEHMPEVSFHDRRGDRAFYDEGGGHALQGQASQQRHVLTGVTSPSGIGPFSARGAGIAASHVQLSATLVEHSHAPDGQRFSLRAPFLTSDFVPFSGGYCFFCADGQSVAKHGTWWAHSPADLSAPPRPRSTFPRSRQAVGRPAPAPLLLGRPG